MATKTRKVKKPRTDSPITVGGGGGKRKSGEFMWIEFNHSDYIPDPKDPNDFVNPNLDLEYVAVLKNGAEVDRYYTTSKVEIKYKKAGTFGTDKIFFKNTKMGVRFKRDDHFIYNYGNGQHYGDEADFKSLKIGTEKPVDTSGLTWAIVAHTRVRTPRKKAKPAGKKK